MWDHLLKQLDSRFWQIMLFLTSSLCFLSLEIVMGPGYEKNKTETQNPISGVNRANLSYALHGLVDHLRSRAGTILTRH